MMKKLSYWYLETSGNYPLYLCIKVDIQVTEYFGNAIWKPSILKCVKKAKSSLKTIWHPFISDKDFRNQNLINISFFYSGSFSHCVYIAKLQQALPLLYYFDNG
jgi:hypothetical protein